MRITTPVARWVVGVTGVTQVALGVLFWGGRAYSLVPLHMAIGLAFVLAVWTLAALAARAGVKRGPVVLGALWGIVVLALGMTQGRLLPGPAHWVVKLLHLLVGVAAMALAARLTAEIRKRVGAAPSAAPADGLVGSRPAVPGD